MSSGGGAALKADASREEPGGGVWPLVGIAAVTVAGLGLFWWQLATLWSIWTTNSLHSIGALVIPTSVILVIRALRGEDFDQGGSWWGLALIAAALADANLQYYWAPVVSFGPGVALDLQPIGMVLYLYASGVVVLFGGLRAWRKAGFALLLLLLVKPVPGGFTNLVDLPLQRLDAAVARSFAALLGVPVSGAALNLMFFHDELGMFIAPGCNGLQSAAAMGLLALVIGHLRGLTLVPHALFVAVAVVLAYLLNLLRLCLLVVYYCLAHQFPVLGGYAVGADYAIGAALFALAAAFLFRAPRPWVSR